MALPAALLFAPACSDSGGDGSGIGTADAGPTEDTGGPEDVGPADTGDPDDAGPDDAGGPSTCRFDQECPSGEVCNLITGACEAGRSCATDDDCRPCYVDGPSSEACGHGFHVTAFCDPDRSVCTRSRASCEPCETDDDCGFHSFLGVFDTPIYCIDYSEVGAGLSGKFCARSAGDPVKGFEERPLGPEGPGGERENVFVNPNGCPDDPSQLFLCEAFDPDGDGVSEQNPECDEGVESACVGDPCPGSGQQRCANANIPGTVPICGDFCETQDECEDTPATPFCNTNTGVCQGGCSSGACGEDRDGNQLVCHANGECEPPCADSVTVPDEADRLEADEFCRENYGENTYCNILNPPRELPKLSKGYRDGNACAPLGCELGEGAEINRDCGSGEACDTNQFDGGIRVPQCVPGCFYADDCILEIECDGPEDCPPELPECRIIQPGDPGTCSTSGLTPPPVRRCVDPEPGQPVEDDITQCRIAFFENGLGEDNRDSEDPTIGTCCDVGCLTRGGDCVGDSSFCCDEAGSPFDDDDITDDNNPCGPITQPDGPQATPGLCFDAPVAPFCQQCETSADCNPSAIEGLVEEGNPDFPNPASTWPWGQNQDCQGCSDAELDDYESLGGQVNGGSPFYEYQRCVNVDPRMGAFFGLCSVGYDPIKVEDGGNTIAAGAPPGWTCTAAAPPCTTDADCGNLECIGFQPAPNPADPPLNFGVCKCGEGGSQDAACPETLGIAGTNAEINAPTRMRCVDFESANRVVASTLNGPLQGPQSSQVMQGDMFCTFTYDCTPPTLQVPEAGRVPQTLPDACPMPDAFRE